METNIYVGIESSHFVGQNYSDFVNIYLTYSKIST